jgi:SAM-dependent methyltransferase
LEPIETAADFLSSSMSDNIQRLYETRVYPAMSHPSSDPALTSVAAILAGLEVRHPARARILEIGCCSGLNLIPLAMRWPESCFVGIDLSGPAIREARGLAQAAGVNNIEFHAMDLQNYDPGGEGFDFIIAHGFLSWVPDEVKAALFTFCQQHLAPTGIATISFNLECGWLPRFSVIEKVRAIQQAGARDEMVALQVLRTVTEEDSEELGIIDDMLAKGAAILAFDDFGPVNDPWSLERFVRVAANSGLRWLGESDPGKNLPPGLEANDLGRLQQQHGDPLSLQIAADALVNRTFRSVIVCREDARLAPRITMERLLEFSVRPHPTRVMKNQNQVTRTIGSDFPYGVGVCELLPFCGDLDEKEIARQVLAGIQSGDLLPRIDEEGFNAWVPEYPALKPFRLECARRGMPLVDFWHQPCSFPARHHAVLTAMDGTCDVASLAEISKTQCPELAFGPWFRHLAGRGMFA